jgi:hypothetical protein
VEVKLGDKQADGGAASWGEAVAAAILALPRGAKRLIMLTVDSAAVPTALWLALVLKFDRVDPQIHNTFA